MKKTVLLLTILLTMSVWAVAQGQLVSWIMQMEGPGGKAYGQLGTIVVPIEGEGGSASGDLFFYKKIFTGLGFFDLSQTVNIYPNPTVEQLFIRQSSEHKAVSYTIHNLLGGVVKTGTLDVFASESSINVSQLPAQLYLLKLVDKQGVPMITKSFIKK